MWSVYCLQSDMRLKRSGQNPRDPLTSVFNKIQLWLVPVVIICSGALVVGLEPVSNLIPMPKSMQTFFENAFRKDVFSMLTIIVAAPILEEIFCRAIILGGLLKNYSPLKAILISATFFGAMHLKSMAGFTSFFLLAYF